MKNNYLKLIVLALLPFLASCEKVLDLKLKDSDQRIVIEGEVNNEAGPYKVKVSRSMNFGESSSFNGVANATVIISDDAGNTDTLQPSSPGIYLTQSIAGVPGRTYMLKVTDAGTTYTAVCRMPQPVTLDTIYQKTEDLAGEPFRIVNADFQDPAGIVNYYRFKIDVNGEPVDGIFIRDDKLTDGKKVSQTLRGVNGDERKAGDLVTIRFFGIDKPVFTYLFGLDQIAGGSGGGNTATPANPETNISGGALGYFTAQTTQTKQFVLE